MNILFLIVLGAALAALYSWAFRTLPGERWQFLAAAPAMQRGPGRFAGVNLTYYGFFSASAYTTGAALFLAMMGAVGVDFRASLAVITLVVALCAPASNLLVRIVEKKRYGFTVGGASFVGLFAAPGAAWLINRMGMEMPIAPAVGAMATAYVLGEGVGRLACISFGCCYGKPVAETTGWVRRLSERFAFTFEGDTKKIAFAAKMKGAPVVPIQAMTAVVYGLTAVVSIALYLAGWYPLTIALALGVSQVWRAYSETLRADYRGEGGISAYQWMAVFATGVALVVPFFVEPSTGGLPRIVDGLRQLWSAEAILFLQALWAVTFLYMGRSTQTGAEMTFHIHADRI